MNPDTQQYNKTVKKGDANRDPITKTPGAHPVATGVGAAVGGVAGVAGTAAAAAATAGTVGTALGGPVGGAIGLAAGAIIGGLAGKAVGEKIDPTVEESYWRESYLTEPYYNKSYTYDDYGPAYRTGYEGYTRYNAGKFEDVERDLEVDYNRNKGGSRLSWEHAKPATRSAWDRLSNRGDIKDSSH